MVTDYEQLLQGMIDERSAKVGELKGRKGKEKQLAALMSELKFIEVEMNRYRQGMSLFRSKGVPKVGRWGKPETEEHKEEPTA